MLNLLLFSPKGSGTHYYGPGMSAYRMYKHLENRADVSLSLAHGYKGQETLDLFNRQYFISNINNKSLISGLGFLIKSKKWINRNAHNFDVLHSLSSFQHSFMFAKWFEEMGVPSVIKITGAKGVEFAESSFKSKMFGLSNYRKKHLNTITGYISISSRISEKLEQAGISPEKIHYIPNGVDVGRFYPVDEFEKNQLKKKHNLPDKKTIIFTGAFNERKNPFLVVKAFHAASHTEDAQLIVIGPDGDDGTQRKNISEFIKKYNLDHVILKDFVTNIEEYYQLSDMFVQPSSHEGLSNSLLEAQACGLPAIVTRISGAEDVVKPSVNGIFVSRDPGEISAAMDFYLQKDEIRREQSAAARKRMLENYQAEVILEKHVELFQKLKKNRRG